MSFQSLAGHLLISMPTGGTLSGNDKKVILICAHEKLGAMGLTLNTPIPAIKVEDVISQIGFKRTEFFRDIKIMEGGPLEQQRGFVVHSEKVNVEQTAQISPGLYLSTSLDILTLIEKGEGPAHYLFCLGYVGWEKGVLDKELKQHKWLLLQPDPSFIFEKSQTGMWDNSLKRIGFDPTHFSTESGSA